MDAGTAGGKAGRTEQAVSKWEDDLCAPDVSLFPPCGEITVCRVQRPTVRSSSKRPQRRGEKILGEKRGFRCVRTQFAMEAYMKDIYPEKMFRIYDRFFGEDKDYHTLKQQICG